MVAGIYQILNIVNNKRYIGSTEDIDKRWGEHKSNLRLNKHHNPHLRNSWNKYGGENFEFSILEEAPLIDSLFLLRDILEEREQFWFKKFPWGRLYNIRLVAKSNLGIKFSEESKKKMSEIKSGKNHPMYGRKHSLESKKRISEKTSGENNPRSKMITFKGKTQIIKDWAKEIGINYSTLKMRLSTYGWTVERALTEPVK